ncbi:hypothetical protein CONPUDRAFT_157308 [Coniophora puteana RWD-64-598 SS2]|uniref:Uncharacterized protein n=1 Tax=Coniophora puteana (strain RWD-64-598) TaxID=741705 RepID=A0A5M3MD65_CONPW|nr:uncharacterized protein CONPUDRAFT_157308 [Coniophora puteana RWD-64-598 SS2]EIW77033.1 hypothetical protein CONPUDRAFT_157308 [Coniophora puteana RWD-64-598 SS2]
MVSLSQAFYITLLAVAAYARPTENDRTAYAASVATSAAASGNTNGCVIGNRLYQDSQQALSALQNGNLQPPRGLSRGTFAGLLQYCQATQAMATQGSAYCVTPVYTNQGVITRRSGNVGKFDAEHADFDRAHKLAEEHVKYKSFNKVNADDSENDIKAEEDFVNKDFAEKDAFRKNGGQYGHEDFGHGGQEGGFQGGGNYKRSEGGVKKFDAEHKDFNLKHKSETEHVKHKSLNNLKADDFEKDRKFEEDFVNKDFAEKDAFRKERGGRQGHNDFGHGGENYGGERGQDFGHGGNYKRNDGGVKKLDVEHKDFDRKHQSAKEHEHHKSLNKIEVHDDEKDRKSEEDFVNKDFAEKDAFRKNGGHNGRKHFGGKHFGGEHGQSFGHGGENSQGFSHGGKHSEGVHQGGEYSKDFGYGGERGGKHFGGEHGQSFGHGGENSQGFSHGGKHAEGFHQGGEYSQGFAHGGKHSGGEHGHGSGRVGKVDTERADFNRGHKSEYEHEYKKAFDKVNAFDKGKERKFEEDFSSKEFAEKDTVHRGGHYKRSEGGVQKFDAERKDFDRKHKFESKHSHHKSLNAIHADDFENDRKFEEDFVNKDFANKDAFRKNGGQYGHEDFGHGGQEGGFQRGGNYKRSEGGVQKFDAERKDFDRKHKFESKHSHHKSLNAIHADDFENDRKFEEDFVDKDFAEKDAVNRGGYYKRSEGGVKKFDAERKEFDLKHKFEAEHEKHRSLNKVEADDFEKDRKFEDDFVNKDFAEKDAFHRDEKKGGRNGWFGWGN